ncbi:MAG TPA: sulfotransferase [Solirubrobacteraceae bacterium]|jgi:hypothetical protein
MAARSSNPVFVVAAPRSGSTLLRLILDAHPEIGCPGETGIPSLAARLEDVWAAICTDLAGENVAKPPANVLRSMRRALRAPMEYYCQETGKRIYCDKSLDAPDNLAALGRAFPTAQYILLFRQVLDVVASGLEVSPYGFRAFGYAPFVQQSIDNFVAPLVHHWATRARAALDWEKANGSRCIRVRYEDMVADPGSTLRNIFEFLGVAPDESAVARALGAAAGAATPGDAKIAFTTEVHTASVGRGRRVPITLIPPLLLAEVNEMLAMLGYPRMTETWNTEPSAAGDAVVRASRNADALVASMPARIEPTGLAPPARIFAIVAEDVDGLAWHIDCSTGAVGRANPTAADTTLYGSADALVAALSGEENPATMLRDGRLRLNGDVGDGRLVVPKHVTLVIRALRAGVAG